MRLHARTEKTKKKPQTVKTHDRVSQHQNQKSKDALNASPRQNRKNHKKTAKVKPHSRVSQQQNQKSKATRPCGSTPEPKNPTNHPK